MTSNALYFGSIPFIVTAIAMVYRAGQLDGEKSRIKETWETVTSGTGPSDS
jgi:hypothetical protein